MKLHDLCWKFDCRWYSIAHKFFDILSHNIFELNTNTKFLNLKKFMFLYFAFNLYNIVSITQTAQRNQGSFKTKHMK